MPLYPGVGPRLGLGRWNSIAGTMVVEIVMLAVGVWLYTRSTGARDWIGRYAFAAYVGVLLVLYVDDRFGAPPPSVVAIAWSGIAASAILIPWAGWFDRHRVLQRRQFSGLGSTGAGPAGDFRHPACSGWPKQSRSRAPSFCLRIRLPPSPAPRPPSPNTAPPLGPSRPVHARHARSPAGFPARF